VTIVVLAGCHRVRYTGDGVLSRKKAPAWICQDEYDVDLGRVDLSTRIHEHRVLSGLPSGEYIVGFNIRERSAPTGLRDSVIDKRSPAPAVTLTMTNELGEQVYSTSSRLADWSWSGGRDEHDRAFVYKIGVATEVRVDPHTTQGRREGVGADGGWGSYFTARHGGRYTIALDVDQPDPDAMMFDVDLEVHGVVGCL
jgi:hypothetical protein